ncbi:MFS transporter [Roseateles chitosanitabidus]|uniref:MFS transporter n=1 Tax=Roseateles chitosanitabidus TaxID=65048 RepID=UPI000831DD1A|nr:MFS transporter [Roseateles chitosanitabidus]
MSTPLGPRSPFATSAPAAPAGPSAPPAPSAPIDASAPTAGTPSAVLSNRNFRWIAAASLVSMLGDQFTLVALPWLVLQVSGDPLTLGTVMAAMGLPRALLLLVGGAVVDRHAPRRVLLTTHQISAVLLGALALLVATGHASSALIHVFAVTLGVTTAFAHPASSALLPRALPPALIRPANGLLMAMRQATMLIGPVAGAALIAHGWHGHTVAGSPAPAATVLRDATGLSWAFAFDACSFALAACALIPVALLAVPSASTASTRPSIAASIAEGLGTLWRDRLLRTLCLYVAAVSLLIGGPLQVALPLLAERQLHGDASTLGLLMAGHGAGVLTGLLLAGWKPDWRVGTLGATVLTIDALAGAVFIALGHATRTWEAIALLAPIGMLAGFVQVAVMSWIQRRVPPRMLGRAMSVLLCIVMGLAPLSAAGAGWLLRIVPTSTVFTVCGAAMLVIVAIGAMATPLRRIEESHAV